MVGCEVDGPLWMVLGLSRGLCVRSWATLGGLGPLLGPLLTISSRSWAALGTYVGGLGPLFGASVVGIGPPSGPLWAILDLSQRLCAQTQAGKQKSDPKPAGWKTRELPQPWQRWQGCQRPEPLEAQYRFLSIDMFKKSLYGFGVFGVFGGHAMWGGCRWKRRVPTSIYIYIYIYIYNTH